MEILGIGGMALILVIAGIVIWMGLIKAVPSKTRMWLGLVLVGVGLVSGGVFADFNISPQSSGVLGTVTLLSSTESETYAFTDTLDSAHKGYIYTTDANFDNVNCAACNATFVYTLERSNVEKAGTCDVKFSTDGKFRDATDSSDNVDYEIIDVGSDGRYLIYVSDDSTAGDQISSFDKKQVAFAEGDASIDVSVDLFVDNGAFNNTVDNTEHHYLYIDFCGQEQATVDIYSTG